MRSGSQIYKAPSVFVAHIADEIKKLGQLLNIDVVKICLFSYQKALKDETSII